MKTDNTAAVVTGGASGLGAATAAALAGQGMRVYALGLQSSIDHAPTVAGVDYIAADVTNEEEVRAAVSFANSEVPLRVVVNCAGLGTLARIVGPTGAPDLGQFAATVRVNLIGTFTVLALAAEVMALNDADAEGYRGVIVNTASIAAFDGQIGQAAYSASKGGIVGMTLPAARDLAEHRIRVCAIAPGLVDTPMLGAIEDDSRAALAAEVPFPQRLAAPAEFAQLVTMVIDHNYLNGETIRMDGALRMPPSF
ncbi:SDR family NAD(P)-dependent oxidoreductase [Microbacteriaceae bacterium VKM Ac-2855]|nr:SDR family NAD(P)-dependent oxidoreductase [Microbacteriaceae bacterium VKM Ac-2855]